MMVSMTDPASRAADPTTSHEELYELAGNHPELRPLIAENPNTYPELVDWLASLGDPQIDAALRRRGDTTQAMPASGGAPATQAMPPLHADTGTFEEHIPAQEGAQEDGSAYYPAAPTYPAAAAYPAAAQHQPPAAHWAGYAGPEHAGQERTQRRRSGAGCCLFIVMGILLVAAVAAALFLLPLQIFGDDEEPQQDDAAEQAPEDAQEGQQAPEEGSSDQDEAGDEEVRPAPEDAEEMSAFSAPSENIHCEVSGDAVSCTIEEYEFDAPEDCDGPVTVSVGEDGEAQTSCGGSVSSQPSQLDYGQAAASGDFACTSSQAGFECWNTQTGNGFFMARESVDLQ